LKSNVPQSFNTLRKQFFATLGSVFSQVHELNRNGKRPKPVNLKVSVSCLEHCRSGDKSVRASSRKFHDVIRRDSPINLN
jgi:hypothetical protein